MTVTEVCQLAIEELQALCRQIQNQVVVNDSVINQWHKEANQ